jgi:hypothetical protein
MFSSRPSFPSSFPLAVIVIVGGFVLFSFSLAVLKKCTEARYTRSDSGSWRRMKMVADEDDDNTKGEFSAAMTLFGGISSKEHQSSGVLSCHIIPAGHLLCRCRNKKPKREDTSCTALEAGRRGKQFERNVTCGEIL